MYTWPNYSRRGAISSSSTSQRTTSNVDTLRALEDALLEFAGCAVVVSHDRWFLDRIATHILAFEAARRLCGFQGTTLTTRPTAGAPRRRG